MVRALDSGSRVRGSNLLVACRKGEGSSKPPKLSPKSKNCLRYIFWNWTLSLHYNKLIIFSTVVLCAVLVKIIFAHLTFLSEVGMFVLEGGQARS